MIPSVESKIMQSFMELNIKPLEDPHEFRDTDSARLQSFCYRLVSSPVSENTFIGTQYQILDRYSLSDLISKRYLACEATSGNRYLLLSIKQNNSRNPFDLDSNPTYLIDKNYRFYPIDFFLCNKSGSPLHDTLLDGELIEDFHQDGSKEFRFLVNDAVIVNGVSVCQKTFIMRLKTILDCVIKPRQEFFFSREGLGQKSKIRQIEKFDIFMKDFYDGSDFSSLWDLRLKMPHEMIGVLFTEVDKPYQIGANGNVLRWQSSETCSINFMLILDSSGDFYQCGVLESNNNNNNSSGNKERLIPFKTKKHGLHYIEYSGDLIQQVWLSGSIPPWCVFQCVRGRQPNHWVPISVRSERKPFTFQNALDVVKSVETGIDATMISNFLLHQKFVSTSTKVSLDPKIFSEMTEYFSKNIIEAINATPPPNYRVSPQSIAPLAQLFNKFSSQSSSSPQHQDANSLLLSEPFQFLNTNCSTKIPPLVLLCHLVNRMRKVTSTHVSNLKFYSEPDWLFHSIGKPMTLSAAAREVKRKDEERRQRMFDRKTDLNRREAKEEDSQRILMLTVRGLGGGLFEEEEEEEEDGAVHARQSRVHERRDRDMEDVFSPPLRLSAEEEAQTSNSYNNYGRSTLTSSAVLHSSFDQQSSINSAKRDRFDMEQEDAEMEEPGVESKRVRTLDSSPSPSTLIPLADHHHHPSNPASNHAVPDDLDDELFAVLVGPRSANNNPRDGAFGDESLDVQSNSHNKPNDDSANSSLSSASLTMPVSLENDMAHVQQKRLQEEAEHGCEIPSPPVVCEATAEPFIQQRAVLGTGRGKEGLRIPVSRRVSSEPSSSDSDEDDDEHSSEENLEAQREARERNLKLQFSRGGKGGRHSSPALSQHVGSIPNTSLVRTPTASPSMHAETVPSVTANLPAPVNIQLLSANLQSVSSTCASGVVNNTSDTSASFSVGQFSSEVASDNPSRSMNLHDESGHNDLLSHHHPSINGGKGALLALHPPIQDSESNNGMIESVMMLSRGGEEEDEESAGGEEEEETGEVRTNANDLLSAMFAGLGKEVWRGATAHDDEEEEEEDES